MTLNEQFIKRIENPENETLRALQGNATAKVRSKLREFDVPNPDEQLINKLSYTYYYDWERDDPRYAFVVQDPGNVQSRHVKEAERLGRATSRLEQVRVYREFAKSWLLGGRNADFSERFLTTLDAAELIELTESWEQYLSSGTFFEDIYLGDVVKYRTDGFGRRGEVASFEAFLADELQAIDPELIFTFGGNAWDTLRRELDTQPVDSVDIDESKMMETHGHVYRTNRAVDTFVLPLAHMSGQVWWRFPPDEYIDRLKEGLMYWNEIR